jgi:hypothetical protein
MAWLAICLPLMAIGVAIAIIPLVFATHHQHKYGHHGSHPGRDDATTSAVAWTPVEEVASRGSVCPSCTALVVDQTRHDSVVHAAA